MSTSVKATSSDPVPSLANTLVRLTRSTTCVGCDTQRKALDITRSTKARIREDMEEMSTLPDWKTALNEQEQHLRSLQSDYLGMRDYCAAKIVAEGLVELLNLEMGVQQQVQFDARFDKRERQEQQENQNNGKKE